MFRLIVRSIVPVLAVTIAAASANAADPVNTTKHGNVAIEGYDPVAYYTEGGPVKGAKEHQLEWRGANWRFASAENLEAFRADPERYAPQYGGYCAWAVSQGYTAGIDPDAWRIFDGKLYLNYSKAVQRQWETDIPGHIAAADANWPKLAAEE